MTAYTSTQSGPFNASFVWGGGGTPSAAGDTFNIAAGHTVTYSSDVNSGNEGFGDSYIYGTLVHNKKMHMNGRLYIKGGGTLHSKSGSEILFHGTTNETHGLYHENEANANWIAEGTDGMFCFLLVGDHDAESTVLQAQSGSTTKLSVGEWIAVFENNGNTKRSDDASPAAFKDEGFWIHDLDTANDRIYFKRYVGPEDVTITSVQGTTLTLSNAKKFSVGQAVIFGTGSNRNVTTISATNYSKNQVTVAAITGTTASGTGIYYTGTEKRHVNNSRIRKVATVTTAASNGGTNTITVGHSINFLVDDEIWVEARSECGASGGTADTDDINHDAYSGVHTISSIDTNNHTITLDSNLPYNVVNGALVTRLTRDIVVGAQVLGTDKPYYYLEHTSSFTRKLILKDVYFRGVCSSNNNVYSGVVFRGYASTNDGANSDGGDIDGDSWNANTTALPVSVSISYIKSDRQPYIEGITSLFNGDGYNRDHSGLWLWDAFSFKIRCGVVIRSRDGLHGYYDPNQCYYNCIAAESRYRGIRAHGHHDRTEYGYCYLSRCERGIHIQDIYDAGIGFHDIICDASSQYSLYMYTASTLHGGLYNIRMTGSRYGVLTERNGNDILLHRSCLKLATAYEQVDPTGQMLYAGSSRGGHFGLSGYRVPRFVFAEYDNEHDKVKYYTYHMVYEWDDAEGAYKIRRRSNSSGLPMVADVIYVPPNVEMKARITMRGVSGFSGTRPYAFAATAHSRRNVADNLMGTTSEFQTFVGGGVITSQFSSTFDSGYENEDITVTAVPYGRLIQVGMYSSSSNATEGFYMKPIKVVLNNTSKNPEMGKIHHTTTTAGLIKISDSLDDVVIRLGGGLT